MVTPVLCGTIVIKDPSSMEGVADCTTTCRTWHADFGSLFRSRDFFFFSCFSSSWEPAVQVLNWLIYGLNHWQTGCLCLSDLSLFLELNFRLALCLLLQCCSCSLCDRLHTSWWWTFLIRQWHRRRVMFPPRKMGKVYSHCQGCKYKKDCCIFFYLQAIKTPHKVRHHPVGV